MKAKDIEKAHNLIADRRYLQSLRENIERLGQDKDVTLCNVEGYRDNAGYGQSGQVNLSIPESLREQARAQITAVIAGLIQRRISSIDLELRELGVDA